MGQITSGIGLVSGINTGQLIDQLLAIDAQPKTLLQSRNTILQSQEAAFQAINAKLLALKLDASGFTSNKTFQTTTATSSNPNVLTATTGASTQPGSYSFTVARLVSSQQLITGGFADQDSTAVGAGTLTFEFGDAKLNTDTSLSQLNGGAGVTRGKIRITDRSGASAVVDLGQALTIGDVIDTINATSGINVTASVSGDSFKLVDNTGASTAALAVANVGTTNTAASLGLTAAAVGDTLTGVQVNTVGASSLLTSLNDGNGVRINGTLDDFQVQRRDGTTFNVNLGGASTLGQVITKINAASGGNVTASVNAAGTGLKLVDTSTDNGSTLTVTALNSSKAAADLGLTSAASGDTITGDRVIAALGSRLVKSLNGGAGATLGTISITNRAGAAFTVELSAARSVSDVVDLINAAGGAQQVAASLTDAGTGIKLTDSTGSSVSNFIIADVSGTGAANLGLAQNVAAATISSGNLQLRYISEATRRDSLNGGLGVAKGQFRITDSRGVSALVDLSQGNEATLGDILSEINSRGLSLTARINDHGDGILLQDTGPGTVAIKVEEAGSTTAGDLGLLGTAASAGANLDGSFEKHVTIGAADTLSQVATKIADAGIHATAAVVNDGSAANPYRLNLVSTRAGKAGAFVFDDGGLGLGATPLVKAQDAVVFYGSADAAKAIPITSTTNTLTSLVPGATISLTGTSSGPVTLNVSRDDSGVTSAVQKFVTDFNGVVSTLNQYDKYDSSTQQRGLLLGDPTVERIRSSLFNLVSHRNTDLTTQYNSLAQIGITVGDGATLQFDSAKFATAMSQDRNAVTQLFTFKQTGTDSQGNTVTTAGGIGTRIDELLARLTDTGDSGLIQSQLNSLDSQIKLNTDRMAQIDVRLAAKKAVMQQQFLVMEQTLARLQQQGNALGGLQNLLTTNSSSSGSGSSTKSTSG